MGDSPFPVIAGAWDGGVGLILVVGGRVGGGVRCVVPRGPGVGLVGPGGWPCGMASGHLVPDIFINTVEI